MKTFFNVDLLKERGLLDGKDVLMEAFHAASSICGEVNSSERLCYRCSERDMPDPASVEIPEGMFIPSSGFSGITPRTEFWHSYIYATTGLKIRAYTPFEAGKTFEPQIEKFVEHVDALDLPEARVAFVVMNVSTMAKHRGLAAVAAMLLAQDSIDLQNTYTDAKQALGLARDMADISGCDMVKSHVRKMTQFVLENN